MRDRARNKTGLVKLEMEEIFRDNFKEEMVKIRVKDKEGMVKIVKIGATSNEYKLEVVASGINFNANLHLS